jgi:hypothetical protein
MGRWITLNARYADWLLDVYCANITLYEQDLKVIMKLARLHTIKKVERVYFHRKTSDVFANICMTKYYWEYEKRAFVCYYLMRYLNTTLIGGKGKRRKYYDKRRGMDYFYHTGEM